MKNIKRHAWALIATVATAALLAGCSDGELKSGANLDITPPAPIVISFYAEPSEIAAGQSTTISWEVAGADKVEITAVASDGTPVSFGVSTDQLSGSQAVNGLASTTDFVLTATKSTDSLESETETTDTDEASAIHVLGGQIQYGPEVEEETEETPETSEVAVSSVTQTITVTVLPANALAATITADKSSVPAGESTIIRWTVTPSENLTAVGVVADSGEAIVATDSCSGDMASILAQPALEQFPAVGCAVVTPSVATTYTINAQDSVGNVATASVLVGLTSGQITADIKAAESDSATPKDALEVTTWQSPVVVSWSVTPAAAKVSIVATGSVEAASTAAPCELPVDASDKTTGSTKCKLAGETTFAITATVGTDSATDSVNVVLKQSGNAGLVIANKWAIEGETVTVDIDLNANAKANPEIIENIRIEGVAVAAGMIDSLKTGVPIKVPMVATKDMGNDIDVELVYGGGQIQGYKPVKIAYLATLNDDDDVKEITKVVVHKEGNDINRYAGVMLDGFNGGKARIYDNDGKQDFDFYTSIIEAFNMQDLWQEAFFKDVVKTYPTVVAVRTNEDVFAGVTGAVMRAKERDENNKLVWENIMISRRRGKGNIPANHPTCGRDNETGVQKIQEGRQKDFNGDFVSLNQICDIVVRDNRVIVAMDWGVSVEKNIDNDNLVWVGDPYDDWGPEQIAEHKLLTFGHVVNDLLIAGDKIYAATDDNVYVSSDNVGEYEEAFGIRWENTNLNPPSSGGENDTESAADERNQNSVWALAYDARNEIVYAGYNGGIKYRYLSAPIVDCESAEQFSECDGWSQLAGLTEPVISLAIDPSSPSNTVTIFAGTPSGLYVTRDRGVTWSKVTVEGGEQAVTAIDIATVDAGNNVQYEIYVGTGSGQRLVGEKILVTKQASTGGNGFRPIDGNVVGGGSGDTPADISKVNATLVLN
ncbi:MAG: hypothetical protein WC683_17165 [bacterium]